MMALQSLPMVRLTLQDDPSKRQLSRGMPRMTDLPRREQSCSQSQPTAT